MVLPQPDPGASGFGDGMSKKGGGGVSGVPEQSKLQTIAIKWLQGVGIAPESPRGLRRG